MPNEYRPGEKLRVFVLFSGGASSGIGLVEGPKHGRTYEVVGLGTDDHDASFYKNYKTSKVRAEKIPVIDHDWRNFCEKHGLDPNKKITNEKYHEDVWLKEIEPFKPHVIALSGYERIITETFLQEHPDTKNVHPMYLHMMAPKRPKGKFYYSYPTLIDVGDMDPDDVRRHFPESEFERAFRGHLALRMQCFLDMMIQSICGS